MIILTWLTDVLPNKAPTARTPLGLRFGDLFGLVPRNQNFLINPSS